MRIVKLSVAKASAAKTTKVCEVLELKRSTAPFTDFSEVFATMTPAEYDGL